MVKFIKSNGDIFSIVRGSSTAFYMWETAKKLNHSVEINGINYGNDW